MIPKAKKILESFEILKKILNDKAICEDDRIVIFDPPFTIQILKREEMIIFQLEDRDVAILTKDRVEVDEEYKDYVEEWCLALTSLGFKRFILKGR
jgi:16S rRNA G966 N2-methylase RsmD